MQKKYFAEYIESEEYKESVMPFTEFYEYMTKKFGVRDITRQPLVIKTIGFYTNSEEAVEKIKNLEWITEVTCNGPIL